MTRVKTDHALVVLYSIETVTKKDEALVLTDGAGNTIELDIHSIAVVDELIDKANELRKQLQAKIDGAMREFD